MTVEETNESEMRSAMPLARVHVSRKYTRILIDMHARDERERERGGFSNARSKPAAATTCESAAREAERAQGRGQEEGGGGSTFTTDHPNNLYSIVCADIHKSDVWITYEYVAPCFFFFTFFPSFFLLKYSGIIGSSVMIRAKANSVELWKHRVSSRR